MRIFLCVVLLLATQLSAGEDNIPHLEDKERLPAHIAQLFEKIKTGDALDVIVGFDTISEIGAPAVPYLVEYLNSDKPGRDSCANALGTIGPDAASAVPVLIKTLAAPDAELREYSASALGRIGANKEITLPALKKSLADASPLVSSAACIALLNLDLSDAAALAKLKESIRHADENIRASTLLNLEKYPRVAARVTPELIKAVSDSHSNVRGDAMQILSEAQIADAVPAIIPMLQHGNEFTRLTAIESLGKMGPRASAAVPALTAILGLTHLPLSPAIRETIASASKGLNVETPDTLNLASPAAIALENIQPGYPPATAILRHALRDAFMHPVERIDALVCLTARTENKAAIEYILSQLKKEDRDIRAHAGLALARLGRTEGLAALEEELVVNNSHRRLIAAKALGNLGPAAKPAIPALEKVTRNLLQAALAKEAKLALDKIKK